MPCRASKYEEGGHTRFSWIMDVAKSPICIQYLLSKDPGKVILPEPGVGGTSENRLRPLREGGGYSPINGLAPNGKPGIAQRKMHSPVSTSLGQLNTWLVMVCPQFYSMCISVASEGMYEEFYAMMIISDGFVVFD